MRGTLTAFLRAWRGNHRSRSGRSHVLWFLQVIVLTRPPALPSLAHAVAPNLLARPCSARYPGPDTALQQAVHNARSAGDNAWMLIVRGSGAADDRTGADALLRRPGAAQEHSRHHDAELRHDGPHHGAVGDRRLLAGLRPWQCFIGGFDHLFLHGVCSRPTRTTPQPFPSRRS